MLRDRVPRLTVQDIIQPGLGSAFVTHALEEEQWVSYPPSGICIYPYESLVLCRYLVGGTVPFEKTPVKEVGLLDHRDFKVNAWVYNRLADGLTKLCNDHLFGLPDNESAGHNNGYDNQYNGCYKCRFCVFHLTTPLSSWKNGSIPVASSSVISFLPTFCMTSCMVSR